MLNNISNQTSKFRTINWIQINDLSNRVYSTGRDNRFNTTMLKSSLRDYSDAYILVKGAITIPGELLRNY